MKLQNTLQNLFWKLNTTDFVKEIKVKIGIKQMYF